MVHEIKYFEIDSNVHEILHTTGDIAYGEHKDLIFLFLLVYRLFFYFSIFPYLSFKVHLQVLSIVLNTTQVVNLKWQPFVITRLD
jgi:hypothetical protein